MSYAVSPAQAEAVGDAEANHAAPHATAVAKTTSDAVAPAQAEAVTEASHAMQLEMAVSDAIAPAQAQAVGDCWARSFRSWRHSRLIGDTGSRRLAGYFEDPAESLEMEEEK